MLQNMWHPFFVLVFIYIYTWRRRGIEREGERKRKRGRIFAVAKAVESVPIMEKGWALYM